MGLFPLLACVLRLLLPGGEGKPVDLAVQQGRQLVRIASLPMGADSLYRYEAELPPGQYTFAQAGQRLFNFLISGADTLDFTLRRLPGVAPDRATNSAENRAYWEMSDWLSRESRTLDSLGRLEDAQGVAALEARLRNRLHHLALAYEGKTLSLLARNIFSPAIPPSCAGHEALTYAFQRDNYLKELDFGNPALVNTSILPARLDNYFHRILLPQPDSLAARALRLLEDCCPPVRQWCAFYLLQGFLQSPVMGMDKAAVRLAQACYLQGAVPWNGTPEGLEELRTFVAFNEHCLVGEPAPALRLPDKDGRLRDLLSAEAPYTLLFFFEADCPVCAQEILQLLKFYKAYSLTAPLRVYAVYTQADEKNFLRYAAYFPQDWVVVRDPDFSSAFHRLYNVRSTPKMHLLNSQGILVGKNLQTELLPELLTQLRAQTPTP